MKLKLIKPGNAIKQLLKLRPERGDIDVFKENLVTLLGTIDEHQSEENQKNNVRDFLLNTYYKGRNAINTKERADLVIHSGRDANTPVSVLVETKRPANRGEMISENRVNVKALHEIVLYFLRERLDNKNLEIKYAIITNINEWYIIDAKHLQHLFADSKFLVEQYTKWRLKQTTTSGNDVFYNEIVAPFIEAHTGEIEAVYFNVNNYKKQLKDKDKENDRQLLALYKLLSPYYLLREPFANDSNHLNNNFYKELLHIIGVEERKDKGKIIIDRLEKEKRNYGSLLENTLTRLEREDPLRRVDNLSLYGESTKEQYYNIALELCLTWVNRVLFLKLLEGQLLSFHHGDKDYRFLNIGFVSNYDELYELFHDVLAVNHDDRDKSIAEKYKHIPYLNSSLFDFSPLEVQTLKVSSLKMNTTIPVWAGSVLKEGLKKKDELNTLEYLFRFLDAYDFTSVDKEAIQEDKRSLINASVLGKIFEKINGYKDGSIFTPGFITMYMSREALRRAVVQKFNEHYEWNCETFGDLYNHIDNKTAKGIKLANGVINSLKVCDPAVGSGHFLVSVMNELIAIKNDLEILADEEGKKLKGYSVTVVDDELVVTDDEGVPFAYNPKSQESQRIQKTLFHEKQAIIENSLFGVDINPNSVKICRLRLWIELLKNAYYKEPGKLETLPNIDINIKNGNSLLSRFPLDADLSEAFRSQKYNLETYKLLVNTYRHSRNRREKDELLQVIENIKKEYTQTIRKRDPLRKKIGDLRGQLLLAKNKFDLFGEKLSADKQELEIKRLEKLLAQKEKELEEAESGAIYKHAFEWRFEFPEVLDSEGNYVGFDVVIGNPPYIRQEQIKLLATYFQENYSGYSGKADIYVFFYEVGLRLLKKCGLLSYITSSKFLEANYGKPLIDLLTAKTKLLEIIDFNDLPVFEGVTAYPLIFNCVKCPESDYSFKYYDIKKLPDKKLDDVLHDETRQDVYLDDFIANGYKFIDTRTSLILKKINSDTETLSEYCGLPVVGVKTGFNEGFITDQSVSEYIKQYAFGKDIKRYRPVKSNTNIIFPYDKHFNLIELEKHPELNTGLLKNYNQLIKRAIIKEGVADGTKKWYEYQQINKTLDYNKEYIVYPNVSLGNNFTLCTNIVIDMTGFIIKSNSRYLLGVLNSKLVEFVMNIYAIQRRGGYLEYKVQYLQKVPIKNTTIEKQKPIETLVERILNSKEQKPEADTSQWEAEIDQLVYKLYGLTEEEIKIVEGV